MAVELAGFCCASVVPVLSVEDEVVGGRGRVMSPRRITSVINTVFPARVMLGVPAMRARRDTLLPESYDNVSA
jgi:hypothetical protein